MYKILLVEDDFSARKLIQTILSQYDCEVEIAINGQEAIIAIDTLANSTEKRHDLVIMDIMMPEMDGLTALKLIRESEIAIGIHPKDELKVIFTTAVSDVRVVMDAYRNGGISKYLEKPINSKKLIDAIKEAGLNIKKKAFNNRRWDKG